VCFGKNEGHLNREVFFLWEQFSICEVLALIKHALPAIEDSAAVLLPLYLHNCLAEVFEKLYKTEA